MVTLLIHFLVLFLFSQFYVLLLSSSAFSIPSLIYGSLATIFFFSQVLILIIIIPRPAYFPNPFTFVIFILVPFFFFISLSGGSRILHQGVRFHKFRAKPPILCNATVGLHYT